MKDLEKLVEKYNTEFKNFKVETTGKFLKIWDTKNLQFLVFMLTDKAFEILSLAQGYKFISGDSINIDWIRIKVTPKFKWSNKDQEVKIKINYRILYLKDFDDNATWEISRKFILAPIEEIEEYFKWRSKEARKALDIVESLTSFLENSGEDKITDSQRKQYITADKRFHQLVYSTYLDNLNKF